MAAPGPVQRLGIALAAAVVVLDQLSKAWLYDYLVTGGRRLVEVLPFFNLVTVRNYGVSFGLFNGAGAGGGQKAAAWAFVALALAITVALAVWLRRTDRALPAAAIGLVIGGALGNVVDRLRLGAVFDFLDFHVLGWHWPAFNLADSAITVGVALLFVDSLFGGREESKREPS